MRSGKGRKMLIGQERTKTIRRNVYILVKGLCRSNCMDPHSNHCVLENNRPGLTHQRCNKNYLRKQSYAQDQNKDGNRLIELMFILRNSISKNRQARQRDTTFRSKNYCCLTLRMCASTVRNILYFKYLVITFEIINIIVDYIINRNRNSLIIGFINYTYVYPF